MTHTHSEYFIEKQQLPVTITMVTGEDLSGSLFVQSTWRQPSIEFDAPALLNHGDLYFPLLLDTGKTRLIAKAHVAAIRGDRSSELDESLGEPVEVAIRCINGQLVQGKVYFTRVTSGARVLDFLNHPSEEFIIVHGEDSTTLVNRHHIAVVHDLTDGSD